MLNPVAVSMISGAFTRPSARARAISAWVGMYGLGMALGPTLGGMIIAAVGWRGIFLVNVPVGLCAIAATTLIVPESRAERRRRQDPVGQVLVIVMLASLFYAIIEGAYSDWRATAIRAVFIGAAALLAVLITWELRRREPLIDLRSFRSPSLNAAVVTAVCSFADLGGFLFLTSIYLQDVRGCSVLDAGLHMLPAAAAMTLSPTVAAWLSARTGSPRLPLLLGGLALAVSTNELSRLSASSSTVHLLLAFGLVGTGVGLVNTQISVAAVAGMPASQAGLASGIASASRQLGQALGVAVAGSLLTARTHGLIDVRTAFSLASYPAWHLLSWGAYLVIAAALITRRTRPRHGISRDPLGRKHPTRPMPVLEEQGCHTTRIPPA